MKNTMFALLLSGALAVSSFASTINQRRDYQQDRIAAGIRDGQINAREASHLENREYRLNQRIRNDRFHDDGHLTNAERFRINRQQNLLSNSIYKDRRN